MKKIGLWLALICVSQSVFAQTLGVRMGINYATQLIKVDGVTINPNYRIGGLAAITLNLEESEKVSAQLELSYSQMGFGVTKIGSEKIPEGDFKYVKIGCLAKYHLPHSINIHAGGELGFQFEYPKDLRYLYNPDFGAFVGAEYYPVKLAGIGVRYYFGFADVNTGSESSNAPVVKQFNRAFQFYLAFRFPGKQLKEMGY